MRVWNRHGQSETKIRFDRIWYADAQTALNFWQTVKTAKKCNIVVFSRSKIIDTFCLPSIFHDSLSSSFLLSTDLRAYNLQFLTFSRIASFRTELIRFVLVYFWGGCFLSLIVCWFCYRFFIMRRLYVLSFLLACQLIFHVIPADFGKQ